MQIVQKRLQVFAINAYQVARSVGMEGRINMVMQTCFFALSEILPQQEAIAAIKASIFKTYARKGKAVVKKNLLAVDRNQKRMQES